MTVADGFVVALVGLRPPDAKPRVQHNPAGIHLNPAGRCPNNRGQLFRQTHRIWYGAAELVVALVAMAYAINKMKGANFTSDDTIKLIGGIYIMVRGLQNVDDGLKSMVKTEENHGIQNGIGSAWYQLWRGALYPSSSFPRRGDRMTEALERIVGGPRAAAAQKTVSGAEAPTASSVKNG
ncbi:hypothetical protein [Bradyrhizobium liaoningense]|uniref:hypothetical protein n=1 Tax=Bradyrhizobium liaoningense TaxID=43992 RepID=UPI001BA48B68|nr:hypothetical protein [Bradyrhizobium liaoningense]MBR1069723.1 hypothetical protein [Bradyrhizobium liaoningense]